MPPRILGQGSHPPKTTGSVPFALLSRKGKHTKLDKIELPESSLIVIQTRQRISEEENARTEVKEQTMEKININQSQISEDKDENEVSDTKSNAES